MSSIPINNLSKFFNPNNNEYIFMIEIFFLDNSKKEIKKKSNNKFLKLIDFTDNINFNNILKFKLIIKNIYSIENYSLDKTFKNNKSNDDDEDEDEDEDYKIFKTNELYIEFEKNINNNTKVICYITAIDNNRIFVTPPNY